MTTAQDFLNSKQWCYKMEEAVFNNADTDHDGYITKEDRERSKARFIDYIQKHSIDGKILKAHADASEKYVSAFGTGSKPVSKDDLLQKLAEFAAADQERIRQGKVPILAGSSGTFFALMDADKDGFVTLEDFKPAYVAIGWDAATAEHIFKLMDKNKSGKIGLVEMVKSSYDFWYKISEPVTAQDFLDSRGWCYKMEQVMFNKADTDHDGYISEKDRECSKMRFIEYAQKYSIDEKVLEAHKHATEKYLSVFGTESDRVSKDDFLKKLAEFAAADQERIKRGEKLILAGHLGTFFDIMDGDKDGFITLEDFKPAYVAIGWDAEAAEGAFKANDKKNSGKIGREQFIKSGYNFWYRD